MQYRQLPKYIKIFESCFFGDSFEQQEITALFREQMLGNTCHGHHLL